MAKKIFERLGNTKTRTLALLGLIVLVIAIIVIMFAARKPDPLKTEESRSSKIPQITAIPGSATSEKYQSLQEEDNRRRAEQAKKTGGSAVATIIGSREKDILAKKESFGIEGDFLKTGECKCPPTSCDESALPAKLIATIEANPNDTLKLMQQDPCLAKKLCTQKPDLALKAIENNKEAAKIMLNACPAMAKALAQKNPALFKQLMLENPDLAKKIAESYPEILKELMEKDPEFARQFAKMNPDIVKALMKNDPGFADKMAKANPDLFKNDLFLTESQRLEEARRKQREEQLQKTREVQLTDQQQKQIAALLANMETQSKSAFQSWNEIATQAFVEGEKKEDKGGDNASGDGAGGNEGNGKKFSKVLIKAGTILFAVLDTSVNSDEPSPVMATITQGPFKGAKLLGDVQLANQPGGGSMNRAEKVILGFSILNVPDLPKSLAIKAVAVDPDTARTALASDVDHHYLLRYGTLLGSSFLTGYAKVITSQGTVQTTNMATGSTTTASPSLSGRQQIFAALGEVGKRVGEATSSYFNSPNTITVDAGTGIGLLILSDVTNST